MNSISHNKVDKVEILKAEYADYLREYKETNKDILEQVEKYKKLRWEYHSKYQETKDKIHELFKKIKLPDNHKKIGSFDMTLDLYKEIINEMEYTYEYSPDIISHSFTDGSLDFNIKLLRVMLENYKFDVEIDQDYHYSFEEDCYICNRRKEEKEEDLSHDFYKMTVYKKKLIYYFFMSFFNINY